MQVFSLYTVQKLIETKECTIYLEPAIKTKTFAAN